MKEPTPFLQMSQANNGACDSKNKMSVRSLLIGRTQQEGKDAFTDDEKEPKLIVVQKVMDGGMEIGEGASAMGLSERQMYRFNPDYAIGIKVLE
mgnify:CR=1 FL=1